MNRDNISQNLLLPQNAGWVTRFALLFMLCKNGKKLAKLGKTVNFLDSPCIIVSPCIPRSITEGTSITPDDNFDRIDLWRKQMMSTGKVVFLV